MKPRAYSRTRAEASNQARAVDARVIRRAERECGVMLRSTLPTRNEPRIKAWLARVSLKLRPQMEATVRASLDAAVFGGGVLVSDAAHWVHVEDIAVP